MDLRTTPAVVQREDRTGDVAGAGAPARRAGWGQSRALLDYALAVGLVGVALLLRKLLPIEPLVGIYTLPLAAVTISAWRGGRGPGLLASFLSALGIAYWFIPPTGSFLLDRDSAIGFSIFVAVAAFLTEFSMARRRAERGLREGEAYLAETQRLSHTGSWAWAPGSGEAKYLSEECRRLLGVAPQQRPPGLAAIFRQAHPDDRERAQEQLDEAIRARTDFELDFRLVRPDGQVRELYAIGHPVLDPSGALIELVGTVLDVTERKRVEAERERLRQVQADLERVGRVTRMGELTASLAHEIRQPIAAAITNAKTCLRWLDRERPEIQEAREAAARMAGDAARAAEIITRVRELFKKGVPWQEPLDVNGVVQEMVFLLDGEARRHAVAIRTDLDRALPRVLADRVQLQQVLMNLMLNGIEAMRGSQARRELTITSRGVDGGCLVSVHDTGPGLPADQAERIFDAFFTTKPDGTGMGLSISRSILESHGGRLWVEPGPGPGATFCFSLPAGAQEAP